MTKRTIQPIQDHLVRLRPLTEADLELTLKWRNQEHIRKWFFTSDILSEEQHRRWFKQYAQRDDDFVFVIEFMDEAGFHPVGQVALYHIDWETKRAEYGRIMIGEGSARGKGVGRAATGLILQIGFETLNLQEIYLEVFAENAPARKIYEDCGFKIDKVNDTIVLMSIRAGESA